MRHGIAGHFKYHHHDREPRRAEYHRNRDPLQWAIQVLQCHQHHYSGGRRKTFTVADGNSATMVSGGNILYEPGTLVLSRGYMWGYITTNGQYCGSKSANTVTSPAEQPEITQSLAGRYFNVYPNPTSGSFTFEQTGDKSPGNVSIDICTMRGEKVISRLLEGELKHGFSLAGMPTGVYFIHIVGNGSAETLKLVLTR